MQPRRNAGCISRTMAEPGPFLPIMLDLRGRAVVVCGQGRLALEKTRLLLAAGASVRLFSSPEDPNISEMGSLVEWDSPPVEKSDIEDAYFVLYAGEDREEAQKLYNLCESMRKFFCSVDDPARCSVIFPAVARSGPVQVSISTAGLSPTLSRRLKERIESEILTEDTGVFAEFLGRARARMKDRLPGMDAKRAFWDRAFDQGLARVLKEEGEARAFAFVESLLPEAGK